MTLYMLCCTVFNVHILLPTVTPPAITRSTHRLNTAIEVINLGSLDPKAFTVDGDVISVTATA